jgi:hypothetical protein
MFAVVARAAWMAGAILLRGRAARVTHTLLFIAALTVSPGVCGACASGCSRGGQAAAGNPGMGVASTVTATHGCSSCCRMNAAGLSEGTISPDASPAAVADAADGFPVSCCSGAAGCDCLLLPREAEAAVPPATSPTDPGEPMSAAIAVLAFDEDASATGLVIRTHVRPLQRPVRILYGVWRN